MALRNVIAAIDLHIFFSPTFATKKIGKKNMKIYAQYEPVTEITTKRRYNLCPDREENISILTQHNLPTDTSFNSTSSASTPNCKRYHQRCNGLLQQKQRYNTRSRLQVA